MAIREALPGNNCGGCGYPGCDGLAAAIAKGESEPSACPVGGEPVAKKIAGILGVEAKVVKKVAYVSCSVTVTRQKINIIIMAICHVRMLLTFQVVEQRHVLTVVWDLEAV